MFVQVTVVPTGTFSVAGENAKFAKVTELPEAGWEEVFVVDAPYPDEHADRDTTTIRAMIVNTTGNARFK